MNKNAIMMSIVVVSLLTAALLMSKSFLAMDRTQSLETPERAYFYDLGTGELIVESFTIVPPITTPSGEGNGVGAFVYTCGDCATDKTVGYLQKFTDKAQEAMQQMEGLTEEQRMPFYDVQQQGTLVAAPPQAGEEPRWISIATPAGQQITQVFLTMCKNKLAKACAPDDAE